MSVSSERCVEGVNLTRGDAVMRSVHDTKEPQFYHGSSAALDAIGTPVGGAMASWFNSLHAAAPAHRRS